MRTRLFAGLTLAFSLFAASSAGSEPKSLYDNVAAASNLTIFLSAVNESGQAVLLKAKGGNTVFAPTDDAWKQFGDDELTKLIADKDRLRNLVLAHIVTGKVLTSEKLKLPSVKDVNGFIISTRDGLKIGPAKIIVKDRECDNGILHTVDRVLIPK